MPYNGFFNGNVSLMIANGTFDDFKDHLVERVRLGKITQEKFDSWQKEWDAIPLEEKVRRRGVVVYESTPRPVEIVTPDGKRVVYRSEPSDNNNAKPAKAKRGRPRLARMPVGALTEENSPLVNTEAPSPSDL